MKVSIIGTGKVGTSAVIHVSYCNPEEIVVVGRNADRAKGIALDLKHSLAAKDTDVKISSGNYSKTKNSDIIVVAVGLPRKPGMSRKDLLEGNAKIVADVVRKTYKQSKKAIYIIVTNPLDVMCYVTSKISKFPKQRIMGMAGVLDTSRFRAFIAEKLNISVRDVGALVLGSHGNAMVPLLSRTQIRGTNISKFLKKNEITSLVKRTQNAGAEIVSLEKSGSAYIAPGASIAVMVDSIINNKKRILPVSAWLNGEYGVKGMFIGVPVVLSRKGIDRIIKLNLNAEEKKLFKKSSAVIGSMIKSLNKIKY